MPSPTERTAPRKRPSLLAIVLTFVVTFIVLYFGWRLVPPDPVSVRSAASICRRDYAGARTAADTTVIDDRVWEINYRSWRRIPSCGELRRTGKV
jgi:hypothetical protein